MADTSRHVHAIVNQRGLCDYEYQHLGIKRGFTLLKVYCTIFQIQYIAMHRVLWPVTEPKKHRILHKNAINLQIPINIAKRISYPQLPEIWNIIACFKVPRLGQVNFQLRSIKMKMIMDRWWHDTDSGKRPVLVPACISHGMIRDRTPGLRHEWPAVSRHRHGTLFQSWRKH